jgi:hypothetical protein
MNPDCHRIVTGVYGILVTREGASPSAEKTKAPSKQRAARKPPNQSKPESPEPDDKPPSLWESLAYISVLFQGYSSIP